MPDLNPLSLGYDVIDAALNNSNTRNLPAPRFEAVPVAHRSRALYRNEQTDYQQPMPMALDLHISPTGEVNLRALVPQPYIPGVLQLVDTAMAASTAQRTGIALCQNDYLGAYSGHTAAAAYQQAPYGLDRAGQPWPYPPNAFDRMVDWFKNF